ncbi:MAG: hypothetical protein ACRD3D_11290 [Terriglobia bacterium]
MKIALRGGIVALLIASMVWAESAATLAQAQAGGGVQGGIVKGAVEKLGMGKRVAVHLKTGEVIHGRITAIGENSFSLQPAHANTIREIPYDQVTQLKKSVNTLFWAAVGVAAVAIVLIIVAVARTPKVHPFTPPATGS